MKNIHLLLIGFILSTGLYAQKKEALNESYKPAPRTFRIGVVPFQKDIRFTQAVIRSITKDSLSSVTLAEIQLMFNNIVNNASLAKSVTILTNKEFTADEIKSGANIRSLITDEEIKNMSQGLDKADLVIILSEPKRNPAQKASAKKAIPELPNRFRMYDLNTGVVIFDFTAEAPAAGLSDPEARKSLIESFHNYYYSNFVGRNNIK